MPSSRQVPTEASSKGVATGISSAAQIASVNRCMSSRSSRVDSKRGMWGRSLRPLKSGWMKESRSRNWSFIAPLILWAWAIRAAASMILRPCSTLP
jgi:hypothetical protein